MRNFHRIMSGLNVMGVAHQLIRNQDLWNNNTFRTKFPNTPHVDVDDIWLRFSDPEKCSSEGQIIGDDQPIWFPAAKVLSEVKPIVLDIMRATGAYELGRLLITRVKPGGQILAHRDDAGQYVNLRDIARYHVVIQGLPGSLYMCGEPEDNDVETVNMQTGEVWWFNAHKLHAVVNNSSEDRIHLLVDVKTW